MWIQLPGSAAERSETLNRIDETFRRCRAAGRTAFIPYIMAGDQGLKMTERMVLELESAGADIVELGVPFSDPLADGPVIQAAGQRALARGVDLHSVVALVGRLRRRTMVPIVLMSYANPIHSWGAGRFIRAAARAGVDGLITPDIPPEEAAWLEVPAAGAGLDLVFLAAPTSTVARLRRISARSHGFIYYVSLTGITGMRTQLARDLRDRVETLMALTAKPVAVGFGISTAKQAREVARWADGVIVGSAIVDIMGRGGPGVVNSVRRFAGELSRAVHGSA